MKNTAHVRAIILAAALSLGMTLAAHADSARKAEALNMATVSLTQATQIAEKQEPGKTIEVEFDIEKNRPLWEVEVLGNGGVKEYKIDASSGAVVEVEDEGTWGKFANFFTGMNLKDLNSATTPLVEAVGTAEKKTNGKAVKVEVEHEHGGIQYDISVRAAGKKEKVKIDAGTGQPR